MADADRCIDCDQPGENYTEEDELGGFCDACLETGRAIEVRAQRIVKLKVEMNHLVRIYGKAGMRMAELKSELQRKDAMLVEAGAIIERTWSGCIGTPLEKRAHDWLTCFNASLEEGK